MRIRLDRIQDEPFRWEESRRIEALELERSELTALSEIGWRGEVRRTSPGFFLRADLQYEQTLACSRCLKPLRQEVEGRLELLVLTEPQEVESEELELNEEDLGVLVIEDETLDTDPLLIEQLQLNVPMRSLCREDCRGLCPACGQDLNEAACNCAEPTDPRWDALAEMRERFGE